MPAGALGTHELTYSSPNLAPRRIALALPLPWIDRMRCNTLTLYALVWLALATLALPARLRADTDTNTPPPLFIPQFLGAQTTWIGQQLAPLYARYSGPLSLPAPGGETLTRTYGACFGVRLPQRLAFYLDAELFRGRGINNGTGLAGYVNGDAVRAGPGGRQIPHIARAHLDWNLPLSSASTATAAAQDQLPGAVADARIELKLGRFAVGDDFDKNRYANDTRRQFMNWDFIDATAYDYAADTRGYSDGFVAALVQPRWTLRYGIFQMPQQANGQALAAIGQADGQQVQLSLHPQGGDGPVLRLLVYRSKAAMGSYAQALAIAAASGMTPNIVADDRVGRHKYGYVINGELPLADGGATGLFGRLGWDDGRNESFAYTEADRALSLGGQLSGVHWGRSQDRLGLALGIDVLSALHRDYLAAGGCGFMLCDGGLDYSHERVIVAYYRAQLGRYLQVSPDLQWITNPGYNRARGPARVAGVRVHVAI